MFLSVRQLSTILLMFCLSAFGCASSTKMAKTGPDYVNGNKLITDDGVMSQIKPGNSTMKDVSGLLGEPQIIEKDKTNGATRWHYAYTEIYYPQKTSLTTLYIWFDDKGVVKPKPDGLTRFSQVSTGNPKTGYKTNATRE